MEKEKKNSTSNRGRPAGLKVKGKRKKFMRDYPGQDAKIEIHKKPKADPETTTPSPDDEASRHKYPPPKKGIVFRTKWMRFIDNVVARENFNIAFLDQLEILCDLYVEYEELQSFIRTQGRTYESVGRNGKQIRFYPEVAHLSRVQAQIKEYSKMLGLLLKKDHGTVSGGEKSEWD